VLLAVATLACGARGSAHRLDELLQAARIGVDRDRVLLEMDLTPGTVVADRVIREIDSDRNGALSRAEQQAYIRRVLDALTLRVDDSPPLRLQLQASSFPDPELLRAGDGAIVIRSTADISRLPTGPHRLVFDNRNDPANSVYLANALRPEGDDVEVTGQRRAGDQSSLTIEFTVREASWFRRGWTWIGLAALFVLAAPRGWRMRLPRRRSDFVVKFR
jgi:hypothetical protein